MSSPKNPVRPPVAPQPARPAAPPVYRPERKRVVQPKTAAAQTPRTQTRPSAPPVYRPEPKRLVQPKGATPQAPRHAQSPKSPQAPPVYRPQATPAVLRKGDSRMRGVAPVQLKTATPHARQPQVHEPARAPRPRAEVVKSHAGWGVGAARGRAIEVRAEPADRRVAPRPVTTPATLQPMMARPAARTFPRAASPAQAIPPRHTSHVIQRLLNEAGTAYIEHILTNRTYGGHAEAHAIAARLGFKVRIFEVNGANRLRLLTEAGTGPYKAFSLLWDREHEHYQVLIGGAALHNQPLAPGLIAHNPTGDGNCMYEAMYYIVNEGGDGTLGQVLAGNAERRALNVRGMRSIAAQNMDSALANILGEELLADEEEGQVLPSLLVSHVEAAKVIAAVYKAYPPKDHYLVRDKKNYYLHLRSNKAKVGGELGATLLKEFKVADKDLRAAVLSSLGKDRSYFLDKKEIKLDFSGMVRLINEENIEVYIDSHQDKHQHPDSVIYGPWGHKRGSSFASGRGRKWHSENTAVTIKKWALAQNLKEGDIKFPKKVPMSDGYIYDASVMMQKGKIYVTYHCNPPKSE